MSAPQFNPRAGFVVATPTTTYAASNAAPVPVAVPAHNARQGNPLRAQQAAHVHQVAQPALQTTNVHQGVNPRSVVAAHHVTRDGKVVTDVNVGLIRR